MNKIIKYFLIINFSLILSACSFNSKVEEEIEDFDEELLYPTYTIEEMNNMDKYEIIKTEDNLKKSYTYYFKDDECVNAKIEVSFTNPEDSKEYYNNLLADEKFNNITINTNVVSYYHNPEYFEYLMYPKDMTIELLNKKD